MKGLRYITSTKGKKKSKILSQWDINPIYGFLNDTKIHKKKTPTINFVKINNCK